MSTVETLLKHSASLDFKDNQGQTALMKACARGKLDVVNLLLESGAAYEQIANRDDALTLSIDSESPGFFFKKIAKKKLNPRNQGP